MAWCRQAASHYLGQCWPRSVSPYGVTRPQWVKVFICILRGFSWLPCTKDRFWSYIQGWTDITEQTRNSSTFPCKKNDHFSLQFWLIYWRFILNLNGFLPNNRQVVVKFIPILETFREAIVCWLSWRCWCPGAGASGHQHPKCWLTMYCKKNSWIFVVQHA